MGKMDCIQAIALGITWALINAALVKYLSGRSKVTLIVTHKDGDGDSGS